MENSFNNTDNLNETESLNVSVLLYSVYSSITSLLSDKNCSGFSSNFHIPLVTFWIVLLSIYLANSSIYSCKSGVKIGDGILSRNSTMTLNASSWLAVVIGSVKNLKNVSYNIQPSSRGKCQVTCPQSVYFGQ